MSHRDFCPWNAITVTSRPTCNSLEALPGVLGNVLFQLNRGGGKAKFLGKQGNRDNIGKTNFRRSPSGGKYYYLHLYCNDFSFDKNGYHIFTIKNIPFTYVIQAIFHSRIRTAYLEWHISPKLAKTHITP